jgi:hypothetical protein
MLMSSINQSERRERRATLMIVLVIILHFLYYMIHQILDFSWDIFNASLQKGLLILKELIASTKSDIFRGWKLMDGVN